MKIFGVYMNSQVVHDQDKNQFYIIIDDQKALMDYRKVKEKVLNFYHTYVPSEIRGQGIAKQILVAASEYADKNQYKVIPGCSYADRFLHRSKKYQHLIYNNDNEE